MCCNKKKKRVRNPRVEITEGTFYTKNGPAKISECVHVKGYVGRVFYSKTLDGTLVLFLGCLPHDLTSKRS